MTASASASMLAAWSVVAVTETAPSVSGVSSVTLVPDLALTPW